MLGVEFYRLVLISDVPLSTGAPQPVIEEVKLDLNLVQINVEYDD